MEKLDAIPRISEHDRSRFKVWEGQDEQKKCLHELFEDQVDLFHDHTAIVGNAEKLTYGEFDARANQLANFLRSQNIGPGSLVGLFFERSERPLIAIMAILKAGAAYIPLDPVYPQERIRHIFATTSMEMILTESTLTSRIPEEAKARSLSLDLEASSIAAYPSTRLSREVTGIDADQLCYLLFTSGTTGNPKGIMTEHRNVERFAASFNEVIQLTPEDRVYQGFSLGFDGSVEEMWMAFSNGAALVVSSPEASQQPNEAAAIMRRNNVTVFSTVPTFLSLIDEDIPSLRLIITSGERCPESLVARWVNDRRRVLNVYGPTETTVNATVSNCRPGEGINIGKPLDGYNLYVLDEQGRPVKEGEKGELYISGVGVARGYFQTADSEEKGFVKASSYNIAAERLYRTGDLVSLAPNGDYQFHGRIDSQVKIRGFRVELSEIESLIRSYDNVSQVAVIKTNTNDFDELAAYITPKSDVESIDSDGLLYFLNDRLPPYMIPSYLETLSSLPRLASGKLDRKNLPTPSTPFILSSREIVGPKTVTQEKLLAVWEKIFNVDPISICDDFFTDLGGYSLLVVEMTVELRERYQIDLSVRDCYENKTIEALAEVIDRKNKKEERSSKASSRPSAKEVFASTPTWERWTCYMLMALSLVFFFGLAPLSAVLVIWAVMEVFAGHLSPWLVGGCLLFLSVFGYPITLLSSIIIKWIFVGRYKAGAYPLWSLYYFRVWFAARAQAASGISLLAGTPVMSLYCRLMGAKIGKNCIIDSTDIVIYDMLTVGDNSSIGSESQIQGFRVDDGMLRMGQAEVGKNCFIGTHCYIGIGTKMEDNSALDDMSLLSDGTILPVGTQWRGSPAQEAAVSLPIAKERRKKRRPFLFGIIHIVALEFLGFISLGIIVGYMAFIMATYLYGGMSAAIAAITISATSGMITYGLTIAALKRFLLKRLKPGIYDTQSLFYVRKWMVDNMLSVSRVLLHSVYTTVYLAPWLRLMGAKIGDRVEISNISQLYPDLVEMEDESFFADGSLIGGRRFYNGLMQVGMNKVGKRSFVGNNARLSPGESLGNQNLLGVMSTLPGGGVCPEDGSEWLGAPGFELPYRVKNEEFSDETTYKPTRDLYIKRYIIDGLRILIPNYIGLSALFAYVYFLYYAFHELTLAETFLWSPIVSMALFAAALLSVPLIKWFVMGEYKPVRKPLWSTYVFFNEMINGIYETVGAPLLSAFEGTPFFNWYLRLMGCKIGKHCYIGTSLFSEFDLVEIGDHVALNTGVVVQNHLFEDRVMKSSYQYIEDDCTVGNMSVLLYDSRIGEGTKINPLSLVMKNDHLPAKSEWTGIPVQQEWRKE